MARKKPRTLATTELTDQQIEVWRQKARAFALDLGRPRDAATVADHAIHLLEVRWTQALGADGRTVLKLPVDIEAWLWKVVFSLVIRQRLASDRMHYLETEELDRYEGREARALAAGLDWPRFKRRLSPYLTERQRPALREIGRRASLRDLAKAIGHTPRDTRAILFEIANKARKLIQDGKLTP